MCVVWKTSYISWAVMDKLIPSEDASPKCYYYLLQVLLLADFTTQLFLSMDIWIQNYACSNKMHCTRIRS